MEPTALDPPPAEVVVELAPAAAAPAVVDVFELDAPDGVDGEELHAARPSAPATPIKTATARG